MFNHSFSLRASILVWFRPLALLLVAALTAGLEVTYAAPAPSWSFRVLRTPHFEIVYPNHQLALAKRYALAAEQAHDLLMPIFKEGPSKTTVVLSDETDESNGLATFLPFPHIIVYPVLPTSSDTNDQFGDWPLEIMLHEYTHILNMFSSHGFYTPLKWIFGNVIRPNAILPRWYLEGLAVNLESRLTANGRLRSTETSASARSWWLSGKMQTEGIADINEQGLGTWPYGARPYLFGAWWWDEALKKKDLTLIETWNQNFARRLPFLLNGPMREQTGRSAVDLWDATKSSLAVQAKAQLAQIDNSGATNGQAVAETDGTQQVFAISPSGQQLVYIVSRRKGQHGARVYRKVRGQTKEPFHLVKAELLFNTRGTLKIRWLDENRLVYDKLDLTRPHLTYRDLHLYDLSTGEDSRLTEGMRASEPSPSPKGNQVVYIQNDAGQTRLLLLDLNSKQSRKLLTSNLQQRLSSPEFLSEQQIVFTLKARSGAETLQLYDLNQRKVQPLLPEFRSVRNPRKTRSGLLFTDAKTNARNTYLAQPDGTSSYAVTNTRTEITTADLDWQRNELIVSELSGTGQRLVSLPLLKRTPAQLEPAPIPPAPVSKITKVKMRHESYVPLYYLWPRYWIPMLYPIEDGLLLQGLSFLQDPVGRNQVGLFASFDTITKKPSYGIDYLNHSLPSSIGLGYAKSVRYLSASELTLESSGAYATLINRWPFQSRNTSWNLGGIWVETQGARQTYQRQGPTVSLRHSRLNEPIGSWLGLQFELLHEEYLSGGNNLAYGRTRLNLLETVRWGKAQSLTLRTSAAVSPDLPRSAIVDLGESSVGGNYVVNLSNSDYLLRGYPSGSFMGKKLLNANLEYSIPIVETLGGWGTFPLYLNELDLVLFGDAIAVDGVAIDVIQNAYVRKTLSQYFMGTGAELRLNSTTAYQLPVSFILGAYYGLESQYGGGFTPFFGIGLGDLGALQNKTP